MYLINSTFVYFTKIADKGTIIKYESLEFITLYKMLQTDIVFGTCNFNKLTGFKFIIMTIYWGRFCIP